MMRVLILIVIASLALLLGAWLGHPSSSEPLGGIECPNGIDLGEVEEGETFPVRFAITNRRGVPFTIIAFNPGCGCISLFKEVEGQKIGLSRDAKETLQPGESVEINAQVSVEANAAGRVNQTLRFRTDVEERPEIAVSITGSVRYGIYPTPREVSFGEVVPGRPVATSVRLLDARRPSQRHLIEARSDSAYVRVKGMERAEPEPETPPCDGCGHYTLSLELLVPTGGSEQHLQGAVEIHGGQQKPFARILFAASVRQSVTLAPASLILRRPADVKTPARAETLCRSDNPGKLRVVSAPDGLLVRIVPAMDRRTHTVSVHFDPSKSPPNGLAQVVLEAGEGATARRLELKVFVPAP